MFEPGGTYGDPYTWVASCRFVDRRTVEILGVTKPLTKSDWRAVLAMFASQGVDSVFYLRQKNGVVRRYERHSS